MNYKEKFMRKAIRLALEGKQQEGGGVFGAVITKNGKEIASCYNRVQGEQDPTQHAELRCIQLACAVLGTKNLKDCELYASCEPCIMCLGATSFAGIETIYFGASVQDAMKMALANSQCLLMKNQKSGIVILICIKNYAMRPC